MSCRRRVCCAEDDRTHLLFSLLDGLRLIIPQFTRDPSAPASEHQLGGPRRRVLIPGVYYVFYKPPESATAAAAAAVPKAPSAAVPKKPSAAVPKSPPAVPKSPPAAVSKRAARPRGAKPFKAAVLEPPEPLEGLYDRRQVKRKQQVINDRRRALAPFAGKTFPICEIGGLTYILNPNTEVIVGLLRLSK